MGNEAAHEPKYDQCLKSEASNKLRFLYKYRH
jgi:hypothetical protein